MSSSEESLLLHKTLSKYWMIKDIHAKIMSLVLSVVDLSKSHRFTLKIRDQRKHGGRERGVGCTLKDERQNNSNESDDLPVSGAELRKRCIKALLLPASSFFPHSCS